MNWNKGFSAEYYACFVDPVTWENLERFEILSGSIKRTDSGLRHSADIECTDYNQSLERWIRIYLDTKQSDGSAAHVPLFTGLISAPQANINGKKKSNSLTCYSVLKAAEDVYLPLGFYASEGINGAMQVKVLLETVIPSNIEIIGTSPALSKYIVADNGETYLSMAEKILDTINWRLKLHGDGNIEICAIASEPSLMFDPLNNDSVKPEIKVINDWFKCPNVFRGTFENESVTVIDDNINSPLSTVNRGREVWFEEKDCKLSETETLKEYVQRRLKEEQRNNFTVSYSHRFFPDVYPSDLVELRYPEQGLDGLFYISNQSFSLAYGAEISEEVVQI